MDDLCLQDFRTEFLAEGGAFRFVVITSVPDTCEVYDGLGIGAYPYRPVAQRATRLLLKLVRCVLATLGLYLVMPYHYFHVGQLIVAVTDRNGNRPCEVCWSGKPGKHGCTWETFVSLRDALKFVERVENGYIEGKG